MAKINQQIGERIRVLREKREWFQHHLAEAAGLPVRTIGRIERGDVDVRISTLEKIANALETQVEQFLR